MHLSSSKCNAKTTSMAPPSSPAAASPSAAAWDSTLLDDLLGGATNDTDALLMELLGELPPSAPSVEMQSLVETRTQKRLLRRRRQAASSTTASRAVADTAQPLAALGEWPPALSHKKTKEAIASLRVEFTELASELKRLQSESSTDTQQYVRTMKETAIDERLKRRRVEEECRQLRAAVYAQSVFIRGLKSILSAPVALSAMDLSHFLHNYTRLPRDQSTRWSEYKVLAEEARFQSAMDILSREMDEVSLSDERDHALPSLERPFIQAELLENQDGCSMKSTNVYALPTNDLSAALRGVCVAVRDIVLWSNVYECVSRKKQIVDPDAAVQSTNGSNLLYRVMGVDHRNPRDGDELSMESRNVTLYKQTNDHGLLLEDFVDDDELHPHDETTSITRQVVGAYLLRRELCSDGLHHIVVRTLRTRRYRFHESTSLAILKRYQHLVGTSMEETDLLFRQLIMDSITHEERALAQATDLMKAI